MQKGGSALRRILLVLAVTAMMVVMALPSAGAQGEPTQYCIISGIATAPTPGGNCYDSLEECEASREAESGGCAPTPQSDASSGYGQTTADQQRLCQDPNDPRPVCQQ